MVFAKSTYPEKTIKIKMHQSSSLTRRFLLAAKYEEIHTLEQLQKSCHTLIKIGNLVHQLQKERAMSNIYLASNSTRFSSELKQQIILASSNQAELLDSLEKHYLLVKPGQGDARLFNLITFALQGLEALPSLRDKVRNQSFTPKNATAAFNQIIATLLNVFLEATDVANDPVITKILVAFFNFMQGKEYAGQERACGAAAFASNTFNEQTKAQLKQCQQGQVTSFEFFKSYADEMLKTAFETFELHPSGAQITQLRDMLLQLSNGNSDELSQLSEVWFAVSTERIDALHQVELQIADHLIFSAAKQISISKRHLKDHKQALETLVSKQPSHVVETGGCSSYGENIAQSKFTSNKTMYDLITEQSDYIRQINSALNEARTVIKEQKLINQAKYILIEQLKITEHEAHAQLQKQAMDSQKSVYAVAKKIMSLVD